MVYLFLPIHALPVAMTLLVVCHVILGFTLPFELRFMAKGVLLLYTKTSYSMVTIVTFTRICS